LAGGTGYDGQIMFNPYSETPILIKNGIWDKYVETNGPCGIVGVPKELESKAGVPNDGRAINNKSWYQMFEKGTYTNNAIYAYNWKNNKFAFWEPEKYAVHFTVRKVANAYHESGGTWSNHKFPTGDTFGGDQAAYCRQWFEGNTDNPFDVCDQGVGIEEEIYVEGGNSNTNCSPVCSYRFNMINGDPKEYQGGNVWIIAHGRGDNTDGWATDIGNVIKANYPNDNILLLDWREIASDNTQPPFKAASWSRPMAETSSLALKNWGFTDSNKLHVIGHSLGTLQVSQLSKEFGKAKMMTLLSTPGSGQRSVSGDDYRVDCRVDPPNNNSIDCSKGELQYDFADMSQFTRSFVVDKTAADSKRFAESADEKFLIDAPDVESLNFDLAYQITKRHNSSPQIFLQLIKDKQISNYLLDLDDRKNHNFDESTVFDLERNFNGRLQTYDKDPMLNYIVYQKNNNYTILGTGEADNYQIESWLVGKEATIYDFGIGNDKIGLYKYDDNDETVSVTNEFRVVEVNYRKQIQGRNCQKISGQCNAWQGVVNVSGSRANSLTTEELDEALNNASDIFYFKIN
jgi:pimeloyl-ACP methyl ester carboxylesterase